ncbi:MAG: hypothetical protein AAF823_00365 [Planctomycetota bacterium]
MPVFLDDKPYAATAAKLGELLDAVRESPGQHRRLIVEVNVSGHPLAGDALVAELERDIAEDEVRLVSADAGQIAVEALGAVRTSVDEIANLHQQAADMLQAGDDATGLATVGRVVELWAGVQSAVGQSAEVAGIDLNTLTVEDKLATDLIAGLLDQLRALRDLIQSGDTVALADALAYEWAETTAAWGDLVETLLHRIEHAAT